MVKYKIIKYGNEYNKWKKENQYYGKQISILGDSISTLNGYNPRGYNIFYDEEKCKQSGVNTYEDTWWGKVIDFFGGELLINNSWSGSRVAKLPDSDRLFPSGCSDERTGKLHIKRKIKDIVPNVIIIYLGTNDWGFGTMLGNNKSDFCDETYFAYAYSEMLRKVILNYPNSEIWCCSLASTYMYSNQNFKFPYSYAGTHIVKYNDVIKENVEAYKGKAEGEIKYVDLYRYNMPYDTIDGIHPNLWGMNTLALLVLQETAGDEGIKFLNIYLHFQQTILQ